MSRRSLLACWAIPLGMLISCAHGPPQSDAPVEFERAPAPHAGSAFPNWQMPPEQALELMAQSPRGSAEIRSEFDAGAGTTGVLKLVVYFRTADRELTVKWKPVPTGTFDGFNNSPRRELAAYQVQRLFLDPQDFVVPPSALRCPPRDVWRSRDLEPPSRSLSRHDSTCGLVSLWMEQVTVPDVLYAEEQFRSDPEYAYFMSNLNLLTYLIRHRDGRSGNFLVSTVPGRRQVFAIDNGSTLSGIFYNWFVPNWDRLRIPAVRRESIERLRRLRRADLDALGVLAQVETDADGLLRTAEPGPNLDPLKKVRMREGVIQLGLSRGEIDGIEERRRTLLEWVDSGRLQVF